MPVSRWIDRAQRTLFVSGTCLALISTPLAHAQWSFADSSGNVAIRAVSSYGPDGFIGITSELYTSANAGADWTATIPMIGDLPLFGIWNDGHFPVATEGLMAGAFDFNNQYAIVRSVDGGTSWQVAHFSSNGEWPRRYNAMHFPTDLTGYAVGSNGRISKTIDGGMNWADLALPVGPEITSVHFSSSTSGAIAGDGFLRHTTNGGAAWTTFPVIGGHTLAGSGNVVVAGGPGLLHVSTNGGAAWSTSEAPFVSVNDLHVFNEQEFLVVDDSQNKLFVTHSGGSFWETAVLPSNAYIAAVHFISEDMGCLVGGTGQHSLIMTTASGAGVGDPFTTIIATSTNGCGSVDVSLSAAGADPDWTLTWLRNGIEIGTGSTLEVEFTTSTTNANIELRVSNGVRTSSTLWSQAVAVTQPFSVDAGGTVFMCSGGSGQLSANVPAGSSVTWVPSTGLSNATSPNPIVSGLSSPTNYTVTVTNGPCEAADVVTVDIAPEIPSTDWNDILTRTYTWTLYQFLDEHNGFVAEALNTMWRTHDGGLTWDSLYVTGESDGTANRLCMTDPFNGYFNDGYLLFHTTDGWTSYDTIPNVDIILGNYTKNMYARNRDTLLLKCSRFPGPDYRILRSVDAGHSWTQVLEEGRWIRDIVFLPDNGVLIGGGEGLFNSFILRSMDGGTTWTDVSLPDNSPAVSDLEVVGDGTVYACAYDQLWRSLDGGATWTFNFTADGPVGQGFGFVRFQAPDSGFVAINGRVFQTVTGGDCWQGFDTSIQPYIGHVSGIDGTWFMQASEEPLSFKTLYRSDPPSPGLRFVLANDTICSGTAQQAVNNSIGYDTFTWWLDGSLITSDEQPVLPIPGPGDHELALHGTNGSGTEIVSQSFHVEEFTATPVLSFAEAPCWANDTVHIAASTNAAVIGHVWYRLNGTLIIPEPGGGAEHAVVATANERTYFAAPISRAGCLGNLSAPIVVSATNTIPIMLIPQGPGSVCTWGEPTTTTYFAVPQGSPTDISGYVWSLPATGSGTLEFAGDSCVVTWDPELDGSVLLKVSAVDACGVGPAASRAVNVDRGVGIIAQPTDITVEVGDPFTLSVELDAAVTGTRRWYRDGEIVATSVNSITFPAASFDMAGEYHWTGQISSVCGTLSSDTVTVTVTGPTGISNISGEGGLSVFPNPFTDVVSILVPTLEHPARLMALDALGRVILERSIPIGKAQRTELDLSGTQVGPIVLWLNGAGINAHSTILKVR